MKKFTLVILAAGLAVTASACGGSSNTTTTQDGATPTTAQSSSARRAYDSFTTKYDAELADFRAAFPDGQSADPWAKTIATACAPQDPSGEGMAVMMLTPVLAKHGHGYVEFKADTNKMYSEIRDEEGLCASVPPDTSGDAMKAWNAAVDEWNALTQKRDATGAKTVIVDGRSFEDYEAWATANGKPLTSP